MMNNDITLAIGGLGNTEILLILLVIVLLFGASRLPQLAKSLGQSKRAFKDGLDEADEEARIEAARRRERLNAAEPTLREEERSSDKYTADKSR